MKLTAAVMQDQANRFVIVLVKDSVIHHPTLRSELIGFAKQEFRCRAVLLSERGQTYGPHELIGRLRGAKVKELPWQQFEITS